MKNTNILLTAARPEAQEVEHACERCEKRITVTLQCWKNNDEPEPEYWMRDEVSDTAWQDRLCPDCLGKRLDIIQRTREYETDCEPAWFDTAYAGERWLPE